MFHGGEEGRKEQHHFANITVWIRYMFMEYCTAVKVAGYGNELFEKCMANLNL